MASARLLLVRHGESEGNRLRQFSRDNHIDLTERGVAQAREAGVAIGTRFDLRRIVASPYHRSQRTARLIAAEMCHEGPIETEHALREREIGALAGAPYSAMRAHPDYVADRFWEWRPPGGESLQDVVGRAGPVLDTLVRGEGDVLVVSHGGVMLALRAHVEGRWAHPRVSGNCEILIVSAGADGRLRVHAFDDPPEETGPGDGEGTG